MAEDESVSVGSMKDSSVLRESRERFARNNCSGDMPFSGHIEYLGVEAIAKLLVDCTLSKAIEEVERISGNEVEDQVTANRPVILNIDWPTIEEFNVVIGYEKISEFVDMWLKSKDWLYCIDFIAEESDICSFFYFYEVKWSIPTKPYPIPQATASVFFTIEVSKIKPVTCPVEVTYTFETSRFIHTPGKLNFQEKWLYDIIDDKIRFFKTLRY